ncbi:uncharacterized protein JCM10292_007433 [Rhodotorula paludigena]|uniref:uncharacterized protein n=1 Tax=Rhodotorula paludigena TaxID=86838 RepID=UPI00317408FC
MAAASVRPRESVEDSDELPFGDFCFSCGNATAGSTYCSTACRKADLERSEASPDDSPCLSAVPPLVSSTKSSCSTPPSSANNSPLALNGMPHDLAEPPSLDLPPPQHRFEYGGQSLPNGGRFPSTWTINYQPDPLASPVVPPTGQAPPKDLFYRRKSGNPRSAVPSPLYFRQKAAAVHSSPAFGPSSPAHRFLGLPHSTDLSGADVHEDDIAALTLPSQREAPFVAPLPHVPHLPHLEHCGRPGCVGMPKRPPVEAAPSATSKTNRRHSGPGSPALRALAPLDTSEDVLLSPRIRALRSGRSPVETREPAAPSPCAAGARENDDDHSAFACYLFSHLSTEAPLERGRSATTDHSAPDVQRSLSMDAVLRGRVSNSSSMSSSPAPPRVTRGMLGGRGPAAFGMRSEPAIQPLASTSISPPEDDLSSTVRDRNATIRASNSRGRRDVERMRLTPGHTIPATAETPTSGVSPFPSPPPSPPTAGRGRSATRRLSDAAAEAVASPDPRGRSKLRGLGAVKRSMSPTARVESRSRSRSRSRSSRSSRSRARASSPARGRGRTRERTVDEDPRGEAAAVRAEQEEEVDERRGRGRARERDSRSRSRSKLRRGRGREVVFSMGAYGHGSSGSSESR